MSQVQIVSPPLEVPPNAREGLVPRQAMLWLSVRRSLEPLAFAVCCAMYCVLVAIMFLYGVRDLFYIEAVEYITVFIGICIFIH